MSHWNYRVMHEEVGGEDHFFIHEVYYDEGGAVDGWTVNECHPYGQTLDELRRDLTHMLEALDKPALSKEAYGAMVRD